MIKKIVVVSVLVLLGVLSLGQKTQQDKKDISAYIVKVIRDVNMKSPATGWQKAVPLSKLKSGYEVQTDKGSLAMILFADQSKLILREKSIVTIKGEVQGKEILSRSVHMDRGNMIFNVKKAETEQFRFSSPISVASIRGTEGGYSTGGNADFFTISLGLAEFTNSISGRSTHVSTGNTAIADSTGGLDLRKASKKELDNIKSGASEGEGEHRGRGETSSAKGVVVSGTIAFDPSPSVGNTTTAKLDLNQTDTVIAGVNLFYRTKGTTDYTQATMALDGKIASVEIPAAKVASPALEYYFSITIGKQSITLPSGGASSPGSVSVAKAVFSTSGTGITITATPMFSPSPIRSFTNLQSSLDLSSVAGQLNSVTLNYRRGGDAAFKSLVMTLSNKVASGTIPGVDVRAPEIEFYFVIKLQDSVSTEITLPGDGVTSPMKLSVPPLMRIVPEFGQLKSKNAGSVRVDFSSLQANVSAISLFHRKQNEPTFTELILTPSGQVATGQLDGEKVKFPQLEYYVSIRFDDGSTITVPQDGATNPAAVQVQSVQRELRIPGQTGSLQKKVLVLKWSE
ncbi:MAG: FecR domain-containing protein [Ignavibacteriales bacterium]|nr:FecR domain-containing protein [Ignavibacteriales bacterium]